MDADEQILTKEKWLAMHEDGIITSDLDVYRFVYFGGVEHCIRKEVWPYLLGHYSFGSTLEEREKKDENCKHYYETTMSEWLAVEAIVRQRENEKQAQALAKISAEKSKSDPSSVKHVCRQIEMDEDDDIDNDVFEDHDFSDISDPREDYDQQEETELQNFEENIEETEAKKNSTTDSGNGEEENGYGFDNEAEENEKAKKKEASIVKSDVESEMEINEEKMVDHLAPVEESLKSSPSTSSYETVGAEFADIDELCIDDKPIRRNSEAHSDSDVIQPTHAVIITEAASLDMLQCDDEPTDGTSRKTSLMSPLNDDITVVASLDALQEPKSACVSPASSNGGVYSVS